MCYHVSEPERSELDELYDYAVRTDEWDTYYHHLSGFEFAKVPIVTCEDKTRVQTFNWGLIPSWTKDFEAAKQARTNCLNAKAETIFEKPSFKESIFTKRCLISVNGFYEWREVNKKKYPYFIYLKDQQAFNLGGIYAQWPDKTTNEIYNTVSIITTDANPLMAKIHNVKKRMPLIFDKQHMMEWLNPNLNEQGIQALMQPFDETKMQAHSISNLITSRTQNNNTTEVKKEFTYPELQMLDMFE